MSPKRTETALISIPEAARRLGIGARRVRDAIKKEQIQSVAIGARRMLSVAVLEKLTEAK